MSFQDAPKEFMAFHSFLMWVSVFPPSSSGAAVRHVNAGLADISCLMSATSLSNSGRWRAGPGRGQKKIQQNAARERERERENQEVERLTSQQSKMARRREGGIFKN